MSKEGHWCIIILITQRLITQREVTVIYPTSAHNRDLRYFQYRLVEIRQRETPDLI